VLSKNSAFSATVERGSNRASSKRNPVVVRFESTLHLPSPEYFLNTFHWLDASASGAEAHAQGRRQCGILVASATIAEPAHSLARWAWAKVVAQPVRCKARRGALTPRPLLRCGRVAAVAYLVADKFWLSKHVTQAGNGGLRALGGQPPKTAATTCGHATPEFAPPRIRLRCCRS